MTDGTKPRALSILFRTISAIRTKIIVITTKNWRGVAKSLFLP
jgi:hypothetical protein